MKFPFFNSKLEVKDFYIESVYSAAKPIIPIGCDCHVANMLNSLFIRKESLPFDWLYTNPVDSFDYVSDNFENDFKYFSTEMTLNSRNYPISRRYPTTEFFHDPGIITDENVREKYRRRIKRLNEIIRSQDVQFLCIVNVETINSYEIAKKFSESISRFVKLMKVNDTLHIYFSSDKIIDENKEYIEYIKNDLKNLYVNVYVTVYCREIEKYGIWGNRQGYLPLLNKLNVKLINRIIPKIYILPRKK